MSNEPIPTREFEGTFIGREITLGSEKKRRRVKDVNFRTDPKSAKNTRIFLFIGNQRQMKMEGRIKLATFLPDHITADVVGDEIAVYLNKEKSLTIWIPYSETAPIISEQ